MRLLCAVHVRMSVLSKFPSPSSSFIFAVAWHKAMILLNQRFQHHFEALPALPHLPSHKAGSIVLAHAFCQVSCPSSSAAIGFSTRCTPSAVGRRPVLFRRLPPALEVGGRMCTPSKRKIPPND